MQKNVLIVEASKPLQMDLVIGAPFASITGIPNGQNLPSTQQTR